MTCYRGEHHPRAGAAEASRSAVHEAIVEAQRALLRVVLRRVRGDRHAAEDILLARRRECPADPAEIAQMAVAPEPEPETHACDCIEPLLAAMRPDQAALIRRLDLSGEPRESVATELGILPNALHVRHHRARRALASMLLAACVTCPHGSYMHCTCPGPPAMPATRPAPGVRRTQPAV